MSTYTSRDDSGWAPIAIVLTVLVVVLLLGYFMWYAPSQTPAVAPDRPNLTINNPPSNPAPAPNVNINTPPSNPAPSPNVNVNVPSSSPAPAAPSKGSSDSSSGSDTKSNSGGQ